MRPSRTHPTRPTLVGFAILYLIVFALAVQFSDFREARYYPPAHPFLFFFVALSVARCQDLVPRVQRQIHTVFLASVVVFGLGTHAPLLSLDRPGGALIAKGYAYADLPETYSITHGALSYTHASGDSWDHRSVTQLVQQPLLSDILPKLAADDQRELSRGIALLLAETAPSAGQAEDFARIERLVPPGFDTHFYYQLGKWTMPWYGNELPKAVAGVEFLRHRSVAAVEFLRHRTPAMHHLALVGIYREWPRGAAPDRTPDALINATAAVAPEVSPHYWRAFGYRAGRSWYDKDRSLRRLTTRVQSFVPRLEPSVQRSFLQGVGELLFDDLKYTPWITPAELERFPHAYQEGLLEGWGIALGEYDLLSGIPWHGLASPYWTAWTKGFSARSLMAVQQGKAQFEALFEGPAPSALESPLRR